MKLVYTHENKILVENARNLLAESKIDCTLRNEFSSGAIGDLAPIEAWAELWVVNEADEQRAKSILQRLNEDQTGKEWICQCGESNEAGFESCWSCQADKISTDE